MKINEIVAEGILGTIGKGLASMAGVNVAGIYSQAAAAKAEQEAEKERNKAPTPPTPPTKPATTSGPVNVSTKGGVQVLGTNPIHFRFKNQDYILKDFGNDIEQWVNMLSGKPVPATLADFFDRELQTL